MGTVSLILLVALGLTEPEQLPQRLPPAAATAQVANYIRTQKPQAKLGRDFAVIDLTTDVVWEQLKVQVVKVKEGPVEGGETFVLQGHRTIPIGRAVGGDGVTSLVAIDLLGDKRPLLIYAFAWGSGVHRSQVGVLDLHGKAPQELVLAPVNFSRDDFQVRENGEAGAEVLVGKIVIGHVEASRKEDVLKGAIKLDASLPQKLREQLK
jgi:hypothetical protein